MSATPAPETAAEAAALATQAAAQLQAGHMEEAIKTLRKLVKLDPRDFEAHLQLGLCFGIKNDLSNAVTTLQTAASLKPDDPDVFYNLGFACQKSKRYDEALQHYDRALALDPTFFAAQSAAGDALRLMGRFQDSFARYDAALALEPNLPVALNNKGLSHLNLGQLTQALACFDAAIKLRPDYAIGWCNRGNVIAALGRPSEAGSNFQKAIQFNPAYADAYVARAKMLVQLKDYAAAIQDCDQAIAITPSLAEAHAVRAGAATELKRLPEAVQSLMRAVQLEPDFENVRGDLISARTKMCDWRGYDGELAKLKEAIGAGKRAVNPFTMLGLGDDAALQHQLLQTVTAHKYDLTTVKPAASFVHTGSKLRIGYFSGDLQSHAVAYLIAGVFEHHDRDKFERIAFSFEQPDGDDPMRERLKPHFDHFIHGRKMSDKDVIAEARRLNLDLAVDLSGYTKGARTNVFVQRVAPIQVNYLGYPGSMGLSAYDYILADKIVIPPEHRQYYSEKVAYLPHQYQPNDNTRVISDRVFTRSELGLPDDSFVFCCFNNNYKITPQVFELWAQILRAVPDSVLWLLEDNQWVVQNLRAEAFKRGIKPERLIFAARMSLSDHLARHVHADLFLDTRPYNAHTTTSDALWAGLPVLTRQGGSFAARVAASLLQAAHLPELVTTTDEAYVARARELAQDRPQLAALRARLQDNRLRVPLFDTQAITRHVETAYKMMWARHQAGLAPDHLDVAAGL